MHGGVDGMSCQHLQVMVTHLHLNREGRGKGPNIEVWQCGAPNNALGKHGHKVGSR